MSIPEKIKAALMLSPSGTVNAIGGSATGMAIGCYALGGDGWFFVLGVVLTMASGFVFTLYLTTAGVRIEALEEELCDVNDALHDLRMDEVDDA